MGPSAVRHVPEQTARVVAARDAFNLACVAIERRDHQPTTATAPTIPDVHSITREDSRFVCFLKEDSRIYEELSFCRYVITFH
jgi:hypothetical protein